MYFYSFLGNKRNCILIGCFCKAVNSASILLAMHRQPCRERGSGSLALITS